MLLSNFIFFFKQLFLTAQETMQASFLFLDLLPKMLFGSGPWFLMYIWLVWGSGFCFPYNSPTISLWNICILMKVSSQLLDT